MGTDTPYGGFRPRCATSEALLTEDDHRLDQEDDPRSDRDPTTP